MLDRDINDSMRVSWRMRNECFRELRRRSQDALFDTANYITLHEKFTSAIAAEARIHARTEQAMSDTVLRIIIVEDEDNDAVLLVDDEQCLLTSLARLLRREDHAFITASSDSFEPLIIPEPATKTAYS